MKVATILNNKKVINGWAFYDWANSAYFLVISTAIFPQYFLQNTPDKIWFFGMNISDSAFYSMIVSISYLIIAGTSPILSGIADFGGKKLSFLRMFTIVGSIACMALALFDDAGSMWIGIFAFMIATIGCAGGLVFYDSFLPEIATEDQYDTVSAKGYTYGYIGSVLLLVFILSMVLNPSLYGISNELLPIQIGFVLVGMWWISFSQITFKRMPRSDKEVKMKPGVLGDGFRELKKAYQKLKTQDNIKRYLYAFFFYFSGVQTVIYLATAFASKTLGFETAELIAIILILQLVAIPGAYLFAYVAKLRGNKLSINIMLIIWALICFAAFLLETKTTFYIVAAFVGLVLGGIQSMSRSTYSKLLDENEDDLTCYFSFYDVLYKLSVVFGTGLFALLEILTDNMRYSVLGLSVLFVIGLVIFSGVEMKHSSEKLSTQ